jgi:hypothetical protein
VLISARHLKPDKASGLAPFGQTTGAVAPIGRQRKSTRIMGINQMIFGVAVLAPKVRNAQNLLIPR